jgi:hypothetical protein
MPDKKDLPNPMPEPKPGDNKDLPSPFKEDKAGQTATDQRGGKTMRGWEDIDRKGHQKGHGDKGRDRDGQKGR